MASRFRIVPYEELDCPHAAYYLSNWFIRQMLRVDSTLLGYEVLLVDDYPVFQRSTQEERWSLIFDDITQYVVLPYTVPQMTELLAEVSLAYPTAQFITNPAFYLDQDPDYDVPGGFYAKEHLVHLRTYASGCDAEKRYIIKKAKRKFSAYLEGAVDVSFVLLDRHDTEHLDLVQEMVRDQAIYWRARKGTQPHELDHAVRLWLITDLIWREGRGEIVAATYRDAGGRLRYINSVGVVQGNQDQVYGFSAYAQSPSFSGSIVNGCGITILDETMCLLRDQRAPRIITVSLGVAVDVLTGFNYMTYKKQVSNHWSRLPAFAAGKLTPADGIQPPFFSTEQNKWVLA